MSSQKLLAGFYISLLQDVNTLRSLIYICHDDLGLQPTLILSKLFYKRDRGGKWLNEINEISDDIPIDIKKEDEIFRMWSYLNEFRAGFIISGSESNLEAHREAHLLFTSAPPQITTITVQHGFECVGFLMNRTHQHRHGSLVSFAADIICGWVPEYLQRDMLSSQRSKYVYTGPSAWIKKTSKRDLHSGMNLSCNANSIGIVCENLHSVRFRSQANVDTFMDQFFELASFLSEKGKSIALRPHPGGQYSIKNNVSLPKNVILETRPSYKVNWSEYSFGISAPSSVLFDLIINQVPTAMWQDQFYQVDTDQIPFLPIVSSARDMTAFACNPSNSIIGNHDQRLDLILTDTDLVATRFLDVLQDACRTPPSAKAIVEQSCSYRRLKESRPGIKLLIMAPSKILPTLFIALVRPLREMKNIEYMLIESICSSDSSDRKKEVQEKVTALVDSFSPDILILCREYRKDSQILLKHCRERKIKSIYYIDDLLYEASLEVLDQEKYDAYRKRAPTIRALLESSDIIYCSTKYLAKEISNAFGDNKAIYGDIVESVDIKKMHFSHSRKKIIGYTGFGHTQDLGLVEDVLIEVLQSNKDWKIELIGTMVPSKKLLSLGKQIILIPPERDFESFLKLLRSREWSIGICPLIDNKFNRLKSNVKWIEYSQSNIATVASASPVYSESCSDGCGIMCNTKTDWLHALQELMQRPERVDKLVKSAQSKIMDRYSTRRHIQQLEEVFAEVLA